MESPQLGDPHMFNPAEFITPADDLDAHIPVLLELLMSKRFRNMADAVIIGRVFHRRYAGEDEGYHEWIKLLNMTAPPISTYWSFSKLSQLTAREIMFMARDDRPEAFDVWHKKWVEEAYDNTIKCFSDVQVAKYVYRHVVLMFTYCPRRMDDYKQIFWMLELNRWNPSPSNAKLFLHITHRIGAIVARRLGSLRNPDTMTYPKTEEAKNIQKLYNTLSSAAGINTTIKYLKHFINDQSFADRLARGDTLPGIKSSRSKPR